MKNKILLFVIVIIIVVAFGVGIFVSGFFEQTTKVDNKFLTGTIQEIAYENSEVIPLELGTVYDSKKSNRYVFGMADSLKLFSEYYENMGAKKIPPQTYNGIEWNIYVITPPLYKELFNESAYGYLCVASGKNGDYFVEVSSLTLIADESLQSDLFTKYTKPLLESIEFKDPENPPKEYQQLGLGKEEYDYLKQYIKEYGWDSYLKKAD